MTAVTIRSAQSNWPFDIKHDKGADLCWSVNLPGETRSIRDIVRFTDVVETLADSSIVVYSGSLERLMSIVANFILETEY